MSYDSNYRSHRSRPVPKILACLFTTLIGVLAAADALVIMAHGDRWARLTDELIGTSAIVVGFAVAIVSFIWTMILADQ